MNQSMKNLEKMNKDLPVFIFSGKQDPVGEMGKGIVQTAQKMKKAGMGDVTYKLYEGARHEVLNEPNREAVYRDVVQWVNLKI